MKGKVVVASVASVVVLGAITAVILYFGYLPLPTFPSLVDAPDPEIPGTIAYTAWEGDQACLRTVPASGGTASPVTCRREFFGPLAWTVDGNLVVEDYSGPLPSLIVLDPASGAELDRVDAPQGGLFELVGDRAVRSDGVRIDSESDAQGSARLMVVAPGGSPATVVEVSGAPRNYYFADWGQQWSPDGSWIAFWDSAGRLLVVELPSIGGSGPAGPRLLAEVEGGQGEMAWLIPGNTTYAVDLSGG